MITMSAQQLLGLVFPKPQPAPLPGVAPQLLVVGQPANLRGNKGADGFGVCGLEASTAQGHERFRVEDL